MRKMGSETVMIVDDDPMILGFIEEEIVQYGYKPILANNAEEALSFARKERIDLLLTDIMMPGINGIDLAKKFAVLNPEVKILLCPAMFVLP
jgi:DNA-binding response OmpR family regulator